MGIAHSSSGVSPFQLQSSITYPLQLPHLFGAIRLDGVSRVSASRFGLCPIRGLIALWRSACFRAVFYQAARAAFGVAFAYVLRGPFALNERRRPSTAPAFGPIYPILERNAAARSAARAARLAAFLLFFAPSAAARSARSAVTFCQLSARSRFAAAFIA